MKNLLLVSADQDLEAKIKTVLEPQGFTLFREATPHSAREYLRLHHQHIQFVFYDAEVAKGEGMDILLELKDLYPGLPIITATALRGENSEPGGLPA